MKLRGVLAVFLTLILCGTLLAACGNGASNDEGNSGSSEVSVETKTETNTQDKRASGTYNFPLDEPVTMTAWRAPATSDPKLGIVTYNDIEAVQAWEQATNVHIEWDIPASGQEQEKFNLMVSSGEYPDMIWDVGQYYTGGLDKAITDGVVLNLNDLVNTCAPDYIDLISQDETVRKDCVTDEGNFAAVYFINTPDQGPWYGMALRQDWLDDLGLSTPVTYDDWYTMLKAFKEEKGATSPLWLNYHAGDMFSVFSAGYGVTTIGSSGNGFFQIDGTVKYGPMEEGYREYLTMLHQWYEEGLLDPDFYTRVTDNLVPDTLSGTGESGAWPDIYTLIDTRAANSQDASIDCVAVPAPVKKEGDELHLCQYNFTRGTGTVAVSTQCENPELALSWINLGSQQDMAYMAYYGVEGDTFTLEDGKPVFTDKILNNPDGLSPNDAMTKYCFRSAGRYIWDRELQTAGEKALDAIQNIWPSNADGDYMMPNITMTSEEGNRYSTLMGDITTYAEEMTTAFILGSESLGQFDEYVATLKSMGIEDAIALQQAALDRFNNR